MGIRLDWEIEADQRSYGAVEDPVLRRARRAARVRLFAILVVLALMGSGLIAALLLRWTDLNRREERFLRDTVETEIVALRTGNRIVFDDLQRSDDQAWLDSQAALFDEYQALLQADSSAQLTGNILDVTIDGQRGRVAVEEIIGGVSYTRVWFYFRYPDDANQDDQIDGWRHVPPDYEFWGAPRVFDGDRVTVNYRALDADVAQAVGEALNAWVTQGCAALECPAFPDVIVNILPDDGIPGIDWLEADPWQIVFPSPYIRRARTDQPFSPELRAQVAALLAERLVSLVTNNLVPVSGTDAHFLRDAAARWLIGQFARINTGAYLIDSLASTYGEAVIGQMLRALQPDSSVALISQVTGGAPLNQPGLDWRDYFTWRQTLELELIAAQDYAGFMAIYDLRDGTLQPIVDERFSVTNPIEPRQAVLVQPGEAAADGSPQVLVTVQAGAEGSTRQELVVYRLVNNLWLRAS
jgi:hypothetical protein